jgi:hypothetical protein
LVGFVMGSYISCEIQYVQKTYFTFIIGLQQYSNWDFETITATVTGCTE